MQGLLFYIPVLLLFLIIIAIAVFIIRIPIMIAINRQICGRALSTIGLLSWLGIFFGITWAAALVLSLIWNPGDAIEVLNNNKLDDLEKLHKLKKSGAITGKEFEDQKKKILER